MTSWSWCGQNSFQGRRRIIRPTSACGGSAASMLVYRCRCLEGGSDHGPAPMFRSQHVVASPCLLVTHHHTHKETGASGLRSDTRQTMGLLPLRLDRAIISPNVSPRSGRSRQPVFVTAVLVERA